MELEEIRLGVKQREIAAFPGWDVEQKCRKQAAADRV